MPLKPTAKLVARYQRLLRRLRAIDEELAERGYAVVLLSRQVGLVPRNERVAALLRRMELIDAELVAIEWRLPELQPSGRSVGAHSSRGLDIGARPVDLGSIH